MQTLPSQAVVSRSRYPDTQPGVTACGLQNRSFPLCRQLLPVSLGPSVFLPAAAAMTWVCSVFPPIHVHTSDRSQLPAAGGDCSGVYNGMLVRDVAIHVLFLRTGSYSVCCELQCGATVTQL